MNTSFGFYIRSKVYQYPPSMPVSKITNINFSENEAKCVYCDRKVGELTGDKVVFCAYSISYIYHNRVIRRCSKAKRHQKHRHHYHIYIDQLKKSYPRGRTPAVRIDAIEEGKPLCRAKTPIWMNMTSSNYTCNNDGKLYISGDMQMVRIREMIIQVNKKMFFLFFIFYFI